MKKTISIAMPGSLELQTSLAFSTTMAAVEDAEQYLFDFKSTQNTEPFAMLLISSEIRRLLRNKPHARVSCANFKHMNYAAHMGFFQAFGLDPSHYTQVPISRAN